MIILVAGGTGFLGSEIVRSLEAKGHKVIVYHRGMRAVPTKTDAIVNCVGILKERNQTFTEAHVDIAAWLIGLGKKLKVRRFVQISAIGASFDGTPYQRTKAQAEKLVQDSGLPYAIIRPSMIFGPGDKSINLFRKIARTGFFPIFANGKVQPVHVDVVAQLIAKAVEGKVEGVVEVAGPEVFTYRQLAQRLHRGVTTFKIPFWTVSLFAILSHFTSFPTVDMVKMLREDNVTADDTLKRLRIKQIKVT